VSLARTLARSHAHTLHKATLPTCLPLSPPASLEPRSDQLVTASHQLPLPLPLLHDATILSPQSISISPFHSPLPPINIVLLISPFPPLEIVDLQALESARRLISHSIPSQRSTVTENMRLRRHSQQSIKPPWPRRRLHT